MGKHRRVAPDQKSSLRNYVKSKGIKRRQHSQITKGTSYQVKSKVERTGPNKLSVKLPFTKWDNILCVGEGDFSFATSLVKHHDVASVTATSYDTLETLKDKYAKIGKTLNAFLGQADQNTADSDEEWQGFPDSYCERDRAEINRPDSQVKRNLVLHSVDATALSKAKAVVQRAPFNKIIFNFPHTGGVSTDVNRQVRANQELLVSFFKSAKPYLATAKHPSRPIEETAQSHVEYDSSGEEVDSDSRKTALATGCILVTLFEGEPYTLWNIRDLARHCGLQVIESFKFPWNAFPGYQHARTIGDITSGKDRTEEGKRKGAWRGEEREARCYIITPKDEVPSAGPQKKRKRLEDSDESD